MASIRGEHPFAIIHCATRRFAPRIALGFAIPLMFIIGVLSIMGGVVPQGTIAQTLANDTIAAWLKPVIIGLQLKRLEALLAEKKLRIELSPEARHLIATEGYDQAFGARPLKRAIQRLVQNPLAMAVLEGRFAEGDKVRVDVGSDGQLVFTNVPGVAEAVS